ncbi:hypothetical protein [Acidaminobacter hydrogenoformans]|uniref:Uncharacterized protein n=1 Tax=Acidaminobacter hydrogenoformans DSM 2784 TaxID=1120920 RepID=A0A1G5S7F8_9FIRM|nr:hypothetical protein [Acidaminobacter hydrogenoformans]SCZ81830.1 hypothetical protein SAMN03080599_03075 [Acidaminobacter hydrogenoformans DSM 2784]
MNVFDENGQLIKSYKMLVVWMAGYIVLLIAAVVVLDLLEPYIGVKALVQVMLHLTNVFLLALFWMIYRTQRVYYINYVRYKDAATATEEERKAFALKHFETFSRAALLFLTYGGFSFLLSLPSWLDTLVYCVVLIGAAVKTVPYKLN